MYIQISILLTIFTTIMAHTGLNLLNLAAGSIIYGMDYLSKYLLINSSTENMQYDSGKKNILLIHGSTSHRTLWFKFKEAFDNYNVFTVQYDRFVFAEKEKSVSDFMEIISDRILEIAEITNDRNISLIGHSMGGLLASYYKEMQSINDNIHIPFIFTLSTPFQGAPIIDNILRIATVYKDYKRYDDMNIESNFVIRLNELIALSSKNKSISNTEYVCIGSDYDWFVPKNYSHPTSIDVCPLKVKTGHCKMIFDKNIMNYIRKRLDCYYDVKYDIIMDKLK
jgi:hypothetical protein